MTARTKVQPSTGPWRIVGPRSDGKTFIKTDTENLAIAALSFSDNKRGQANAWLIAAAPDLLDALEGVLEWHSDHGEFLSGGELAVVRAAIAKARGGA